MLCKYFTDNLLHEGVRFTVHITSRLVQDEDLAFAQHSPREAEELTFSLRERLRLELRVQPTARLNRVPEVHPFQRRNNVVVCSLAGSICIGAHRIIQNERVLRDSGYSRADNFAGNGTKIETINEDGARI